MRHTSDMTAGEIALKGLEDASWFWGGIDEEDRERAFEWLEAKVHDEKNETGFWSRFIDRERA